MRIITPRMQSIANASLGADADDAISRLLCKIEASWQRMEFDGAGQCATYWLQKLQWICTDLARARNRRTVVEADYARTRYGAGTDGIAYHDDAVERRDFLQLVLNVARASGQEQICELILKGHSVRETARMLRISIATVSRRTRNVVNAVRKHMEGVARFPREERGFEMNFERAGNIMRVVQSGKLLAVVELAGKEVKSIVVKTKSITAADIVNAVKLYLKDECPAIAEEAAVAAPNTPQEAAESAADAAPAAPLSKPAPVNKNRHNKPPIDLTAIRKFPATVQEWQERCGGKGYCLGGSGHAVNKRFHPGYDAKLKSALKRIGSDAAKALAKELGWFDMIKW